MDFFGIGTGEVLLILIVALIVFGPGRIVEIGRTLGRMMHTLKKASSDLTAQVTKELDGEEKNRPPQSEKEISNRTKPSKRKTPAQDDRP
ncbi:twin-arginine translocase TatA/TatE family subunit [Chloroflexota bacterium]